MGRRPMQLIFLSLTQTEIRWALARLFLGTAHPAVPSPLEIAAETLRSAQMRLTHSCFRRWERAPWPQEFLGWLVFLLIRNSRSSFARSIRKKVSIFFPRRK